MRANDLRKLPVGELPARLKAERLHLEELREKLAQKKLKNVGEIRAAQKEIARILTLIKEKELEAEQR